MSTEGCKLGVIEMLGKTKMGKSKVDELTKKIESVMAVNEKYGGIDGHTGRQEVVDDFIETMTIERNKQKINKMLNAKKIQEWIDKIKTTEKDPKYYEQALLDIILGGDHYRNGMVQNSDTLMNNTVDAFLSDLKRAKVYDTFNGADVELQDLIVREIRIASGSKVDIPTGNKVAERIGAIVNKHRENARILHNDYGGNIGKVDGYEGKTRYSSSRMLTEGKEAYTKFALKHYDWERIEKTKGELIDDQVGYISDVFNTVTGEVHKPTDYFGKNRKSVSSSFEKQKSIYFKTGSWEIHNRRFGETDVLTNTVEQLLSISRATGAMRVGGPNPIDNLTRAATELNTVAGAKINMDKIALKLEVATGKAFVPDSQRYKNIEDVTKNINMFAQLHSAIFTAFFTDPLSAGMVYKRVGASWWKGVSNSIEGSIRGLSKSERNSINDSVNFMLGSDPHHLGSRFEGVEAGGLGGKLTHKYFMLQGLSQITDGSRVKHAKFMMFQLGKYSKTGWGTLNRDLRKTLEFYDIGQQDWDVIRKHGLVDNDGMPIVEPNTLSRMNNDEVKQAFGVESAKEVRLSRDGVVGKVNNLIHDLASTATITSDARSRNTASGAGHVKQGTAPSTAVNLAMQYKGVVIAWHQKVLRPAIMPIRGEKFDKLNLVKQGGVMLAYSVVAGQLIGRTKEAIQNLATGRNDSNYDLFDDNGEIDLGVLGRSLIIGGGTGLYGDIILNLSEPQDFINSFIPATNLLFSPIELGVGYIKGSNNIDRKWNKVFKSMTPSLFYTKELVNSSIVDGLDLIFENNLEEHRKRVKDRYSK
jgi:hypothetical protein